MCDLLAIIEPAGEKCWGKKGDQKSHLLSEKRKGLFEAEELKGEL